MLQVSLFEESATQPFRSQWDEWLESVDVRFLVSLTDWEDAVLDVRLAGRCGLDFETTGLDPYSAEIRLVSISVPRDRAMVGKDGVSPKGRADVWVADLFQFSPEDRNKVLEGLVTLIEDPGIVKVIQNAGFELKFVRVAHARRVAARPISFTL